jgi:hypothetical protein
VRPSGPTKSRLPFWFLLAVLALHFLLVLRHHARPVITDEHYFIGKARYFAEHHAFPPASARELDIVAGRVWGTSDWRPQGYAVFLTLLGALDDPAALRLRVTVVQFTLIAALLVAFYLVAARDADNRQRWFAALLLALSPWPFEFANDIGPDTVNAFLTGTALLLAWSWATSRSRGAWWLFAAVLTASSTLLFRPEMVAMAPVIAGAALLVRRCYVHFAWRDLAIAAASFLLVVSIQVAYRTQFTGQPGLFGALRISNRGAFAWTRTWIGTEKEAYDYVYAVTEGRPATVPARAFSDPSERATVEHAVQLAREHGYNQAVDTTFADLAAKRRHQHPLLVAGVRAMNLVQLWIHLETNAPILQALTPVPRPLRRPLLGILLLLKIAAVVLAPLATARALRRWHRGQVSALDALTLLCATYILARTLFVGIVLDWRVHRYVVSAWPPLLWCALRVRSSASTEPSET